MLVVLFGRRVFKFVAITANDGNEKRAARPLENVSDVADRVNEILRPNVHAPGAPAVVQCCALM